MTTLIARISNFVGRTLAAAVTVALIGGAAARADEKTPQQRAEAEMNGGKDYSAAWAAASRATGQGRSETLIAWARNAESALNEGRNYQAAWAGSRSSTGSGYSPDLLARAGRALEELSAGQDYAAARGAVDAHASSPARPAQVEAGRDGASAVE